MLQFGELLISVCARNERNRMLPEADMTTIIGIDYSGAKGDRNTWVAYGRLKSNGALVF